MNLAEKITNLRKSKGLSQEGLAEKLNVSRQAVSRWESGSAMPDAGNLLQISRLFGVTADFLLHDEFESDQDVPAVNTAKRDARGRQVKLLAFCTAAFGAVCNLGVYVISRFVEVMIPRITYEGGERWYHWDPSITGRSYSYFIREYELELLVALFWVLTIGGLAAAVIPRERAALWKEKAKAWLNRRRG